MRTPWHIRAWAMGASLSINGALALGVMTLHAGAPPQMEDTSMLVSLGDPARRSIDNAASPEAKSAPTPEVATSPPPPSSVQAKPRPIISPPDNALAQAAAPRPPSPSTATSEASARAAVSASEAAAPIGAKAMVATAARPPTGSPNADNLQAHAGSSNSYAARVRAWLESNKTYPKAARMRKQQGTARVVFILDRSGHVLDCRLVGPTGHALLDQEALAMVTRSDPFPAPPHAVKGDRIELDAPVEFSLAR